MKYISTRGNCAPISFKETVLAGLALDGGLYVPEDFPRLADAAPTDYGHFSARTIQPYTGTDLPNLAQLTADSYRAFGAPLKQLDDNLYLFELFHGPTLAFKDFALQLLGRILPEVTSEQLLILGATSGDTGSAAMEGCRHAKNAQIFILYPHERPSEIQRRQMTTLDAPNVHALAVEGSFDDCQDMVKAIFNDPAMRQKYKLTAVNSINWARIMAQIAYYAWACALLPDKAVQFVVPTGNFGNVYAGYAAQRMGARIAGLHIATNRNDAMVRILSSRTMARGTVHPSLSPSMDIQIPSNFERYLFECVARDGQAVQDIMLRFKTNGVAALPDLGTTFTASRHDDAQTLETMAHVYKTYGEIIDPHTAVAVAAALEKRKHTDAPVVALACAHPAKFPDAVFKATGVHPSLPAGMEGLLKREEKFTVIPPQIDALKAQLACA